MDHRHGEPLPLWLATAELPAVPRLETDATAEVCIVGAGIAGMSVAYELARKGHSVVVIDRARPGEGMTGRTTAHFSNAFDNRYFHVERTHGVGTTRLVAESHTAAIERVAHIARDEAIACDLERLDGWLFTPDRDPEMLREELEAALRAGLTGIELLPRAPLDRDTGPALRFPDQLQLHPLSYLRGLVRAVLHLGGRIHGDTQAVSIEGGKDARVHTAFGPTIHARWIVVATNTPFNNRTVMHTKQAAYQTYVLAADVPRGSVQRALYWDTLERYHYARLHTVGSGTIARELLIVGGEDHKTGQEHHAEQRWASLERWMRALFPQAGAIEYRWSGEVMEPVDALAYIGRNPMDHDNVLVVTGDSGNGMTHGVIAGMLLTDLIEGRWNAWSEIYDPSRKTLRTLGVFARENLNVAREYGEWLKPGEVRGPEDVPPGEGALVRRGLKMHAVFVDTDGHAHEMSAVCPHLGCVVQWNGAEKTWDCPCHGSRFTAEGRALHGPANRDLARVEQRVRDVASAGDA